jgi:DinB superfamily
MHDLVVRDLEQARNRTLGLTDLDDPTLVTQHDPLMSPLVWDLAHVGQQEELWLLWAGDPARPRMLPPAVGVVRQPGAAADLLGEQLTLVDIARGPVDLAS